MRLEPIPPIERLQPASPPRDTAAPAEGFDRVLAGVLGGATAADAQATQAIQDLATGAADDVHTATLAVAQADLAFRLALELRNRLTEAFQEILRLQV
jgi:flagellar hook-basal body complex protein FliE